VVIAREVTNKRADGYAPAATFSFHDKLQIQSADSLGVSVNNLPNPMRYFDNGAPRDRSIISLLNGRPGSQERDKGREERISRSWLI